MIIGDIMTRRVVTVEMDDPLSVIEEIFQNVQFHHVLVLNEGELVGIISDRDVLKTMSPFLGTISELPRDQETMTRPAHQIMTRNPITVPPEMTIKDAARRLLAKGVSCLPVVSEEKEIMGIVTWKDIFKAYLRE